jgi:hypothetical protein
MARKITGIVNERLIFKDIFLIRIIANDGDKEMLVDKNKLIWRTRGNEEVLALEEISNQLTRLGYNKPFFVWSELGLSGEIYRFTHDEWKLHGETKGFS